MKEKKKSYELICPECNGEGFKVYNRDNSWVCTDICPKCKGKRIIDWIENIMGVKKYNMNGNAIHISNSNSPGIYIEQASNGYGIIILNVNENKDFKS